MWNSRRILKDIADAGKRRSILAEFWKHAEPASRALAAAKLAQALHFRDETIRKMPAEKKADLLAGRLGAADFEQFFEMALMQYHTHHATELMAAFLDEWKIPHVNGSIEADEYEPPTAEQVRQSVGVLGSRFDRRDIALYLASAGLIMGEGWREGVWPVVDELIGE